MNSENFEQILTFVRTNVTSDTWKSIDIAMALEPYSSSLFELVLIDKAMAITTILHDFRGLQSNDVDFLPRLELN
jgi:hypothetical protein